MNVALWALQSLLALAFLGAGANKLAQSREKLLAHPMMGWAHDFTAGQVKLVGLAEVLGAVGLVVPSATGIAPVLTPVAAGCLALLMAGATWTHVRRKEPTVPSVVLGLLAVAVAVGRSL